MQRLGLAEILSVRLLELASYSPAVAQWRVM